MAVYTFQRVMVWDQMGGNVKLARNVRVDALDPNTGAVPAGLTQDGAAVSFLTSDSSGVVEFSTTDVTTVELVSPNGLVQRATSQDAIEAAAGAAVSNDAAIAGAISSSGSSTQSALGTYGDARWQRDLGAVNAADYGVTADGTTDDAAALTSALAAAEIVVLPAGTIALGSKVTIPTGRTIITRGATFKGLTATGDFLLRVQGGTTVIGGLRVTVAAGANVRGVEMVGDSIEVDLVSVTAPAAGAGVGDGNDCALTLTSVTDARLGRVEATNFDYPVKLDTCAGVVVERLDLSTYVRGVYVKDCTDLSINGGIIATASPNAAVSPGHNGILIESVALADSTRDVTIRDLRVSDAGEHGYRVGGSLRASRLRLIGCTASNVGGCGFKVLGNAASKHEDVTLTDCTVEDAGQTGTNAAGFMLQYVKRAKVNGPIVRKRSKAYSASEGFNIQGAEQVSVNDPDVADVSTAGFAVRQNLGNCTNVTLDGGRITTPAGAVGILIDYTGTTFRRVGSTGTPQVEPTSGGWAVSILNTGGTGTLVGTPWIERQSVATGTLQVDTASTATGYCCVARAPFSAAPVFKAGSQWIDGGLRVSDGASWVVK